MRRYTYRVMTCNGAGVHGLDYVRCADAKARAQRLAELERDRDVKLGPYEIERRERVTSTSCRYWVRRRRSWVPWSSAEDATVREPDWIYA